MVEVRATEPAHRPPEPPPQAGDDGDTLVVPSKAAATVLRNLMEASNSEASKSISVAEESTGAEEVMVIKNHLLAALIKHAFNFFFVVILAGYIFCVYGALKYFPLFYAVVGIIVMSPYFILMLKALPLLKGFYIEKYATDPYQAPAMKM